MGTIRPYDPLLSGKIANHLSQSKKVFHTELKVASEARRGLHFVISYDRPCEDSMVQVLQ